MKKSKALQRREFQKGAYKLPGEGGTSVQLKVILGGYHQNVIHAYKTIGPGKTAEAAKEEIHENLDDQFDRYIQEAKAYEQTLARIHQLGMVPQYQDVIKATIDQEEIRRTYNGTTWSMETTQHGQRVKLEVDLLSI